jgi:hypothetical protein
MDACGPLLATHFLLEKQVEARQRRPIEWLGTANEAPARCPVRAKLHRYEGSSDGRKQLRSRRKSTVRSNSANRHEALVLIIHAVGEANVLVLPTIFRNEIYINRHSRERLKVLAAQMRHRKFECLQ